MFHGHWYDFNNLLPILYSIGFFGVLIGAGIWLVRNAKNKKHGEK
ncbi:MAG: hypothetical protein Fur0040_08740 [Sideroxydans sp.]